MYGGRGGVEAVCIMNAVFTDISFASLIHLRIAVAEHHEHDELFHSVQGEGDGDAHVGERQVEEGDLKGKSNTCK